MKLKHITIYLNTLKTEILRCKYFKTKVTKYIQKYNKICIVSSILWIWISYHWCMLLDIFRTDLFLKDSIKLEIKFLANI
jgi:hypothetical protein